MKRKFASMRIFASEYLLECEIRLKFCEYSLQNEYFEANIRQCKKMYLFCNKDLYSNLSEYFAANMKRMMRIIA
jgi:hypothetical protein